MNVYFRVNCRVFLKVRRTCHLVYRRRATHRNPLSLPPAPSHWPPHRAELQGLVWDQVPIHRAGPHLELTPGGLVCNNTLWSREWLVERRWICHQVNMVFGNAKKYCFEVDGVCILWSCSSWCQINTFNNFWMILDWSQQQFGQHLHGQLPLLIFLHIITWQTRIWRPCCICLWLYHVSFLLKCIHLKLWACNFCVSYFNFLEFLLRIFSTFVSLIPISVGNIYVDGVLFQLNYCFSTGFGSFCGLSFLVSVLFVCVCVTSVTPVLCLSCMQCYDFISTPCCSVMGLDIKTPSQSKIPL